MWDTFSKRKYATNSGAVILAGFAFSLMAVTAPASTRAGTYAIALTHDLNGNRRTDTDFLGRPTEDWGVSRGARPLLRAPRFDEAAFVARLGKWNYEPRNW